MDGRSKVERPRTGGGSVPAVNMLSSFSDSLSCLYCNAHAMSLACTVSGCAVRVVVSSRRGRRKGKRVPLS